MSKEPPGRTPGRRKVAALPQPKAKTKDPAAIARGKKSAASRSPFERQQIAAKAGRAGGARRAELSKEERSRLAKIAAEARWKDKKK